MYSVYLRYMIHTYIHAHIHVHLNVHMYTVSDRTSFSHFCQMMYQVLRYLYIDICCKRIGERAGLQYSCNFDFYFVQQATYRQLYIMHWCRKDPIFIITKFTEIVIIININIFLYMHFQRLACQIQRHALLVHSNNVRLKLIERFIDQMN